MTFNFDEPVNRRDSECVKWHTFEEDVIPMGVADMDFKSPQPVIEALLCRVNHGVFGYPNLPEGIEGAVIDWLYNRHGWLVSQEDLIFIPGVVPGFNLAAHAVTRPGDGVILQTPTYGPFFQVADNADLVQQEMELTVEKNGQYSIDFDKFKACMTGRSRVFMLCNPQNPTGRVFRKDELERLAEICLRNNIIICADEIHSDLVFSESKHIPIASISPEISSQTITLIAPSKTFNIAGLHTSVAVIQNEKLRTKFNSARKGLMGGVNLLGFTAAMAAYQEGLPWLDALMIYLESNRDFLTRAVNEEIPGIKMAKPEGTYLAWLDCREADLPGRPGKVFRKKAHVGMVDGEWFGKGGKGFVRLNFGSPRSMLQDAVEKMKEALLKS